jgi:hypothetical protein
MEPARGEVRILPAIQIDFIRRATKLEILSERRAITILP